MHSYEAVVESRRALMGGPPVEGPRRVSWRPRKQCAYLQCLAATYRFSDPASSRSFVKRLRGRPNERPRCREIYGFN